MGLKLDNMIDYGDGGWREFAKQLRQYCDKHEEIGDCSYVILIMSKEKFRILERFLDGFDFMYRLRDVKRSKNCDVLITIPIEREYRQKQTKINPSSLSVRWYDAKDLLTEDGRYLSLINFGKYKDMLILVDRDVQYNTTLLLPDRYIVIDALSIG